MDVDGQRQSLAPNLMSVTFQKPVVLIVVGFIRDYPEKRAINDFVKRYKLIILNNFAWERGF